jgi:hypothetical protein
MKEPVPYPAPDGYGWKWVGYQSATQSSGWMLVYLGAQT